MLMIILSNVLSNILSHNNIIPIEYFCIPLAPKNQGTLSLGTSPLSPSPSATLRVSVTWSLGKRRDG